jgi:hypothetical protein
MFNIFIGYDSKEPIAYHVLAHSILRRSSLPVSMTPLVLQSLPMYRRQRTAMESTEFSLTRFLVPYLSGFQGYSLFMDSDMLCLTDLSRFIQDEICWHGDGTPCGTCDRAVWVVPHDYTPKTATKFLGQPQSVYPRKNWSSFMLFNNARCAALTPAYVNALSGLALHRLQWIQEEQIGQLPLEYNWLVGEYEPHRKAKVLHYTLGGPWFPDYVTSAHAQEWFDEKAHMEGAAR